MRMWLLSIVVSIVAYFVAVLVRVLLRGLTMAVSHRFPAAPLGDVETYTALWCLAHAQAIYDLCFSTANDVSGNGANSAKLPADQVNLGTKALSSDARASSGDSFTNSARSTPYGCPRPSPIDVAENLQLFPRGPPGSTGVSPEMGGMSFPGGPMRRQGVLFFVRCRESTRGADAPWPSGDGTQQRTSDLPLPAVQLLTDVSEMDLAVLTIDPPHGSSGQPNIDASVDTVVSGVRALLEYFGKRDGSGAAGSGTSLASTPTTTGLRMPSFPTAKALAQLPPRVVLGGSGFGATVAMLALIRRYIALNHCEGLLLVDPFVGWAGSAHNRKVSFIDNSLASLSSDGGSAAASPSASFHNAHAVSPGATPKRSALPSATAGKANTAQSPRMSRSSRSPVQKKGGGGLSGLLWDFVHDLCTEVKTRVRKELSKRPLRQWFPATQWSANGSDTPVCMILDATSVWLDDQLEFAAKWQSTGDDLECHVWCGDRSTAGCALPQGVAALKQSLKRPPRVPASVPHQAYVGLGPASPAPTPRTSAELLASQQAGLGLGDTVTAGARWLAAIRGVPSTPEVSMMMSTPHFEAATRAWNAPQHAQQHPYHHTHHHHLHLGAPANGPSWSNYQGLPASATHMQMPAPASAAGVAAQPVPVSALHGSLAAPHVRVAKRGVREDGHSLVSTVGQSPGNANGGTQDPDAPGQHAIVGLASAPSADSISELLRDHPHSM